MKKNDGGSISSLIGGFVGMTGSSPCSAAKGVMRVLSKSATVDYGKD